MTITPSVNLNGNDQRELLQGYLLAIHTMRAAISYTAMTAPHGRDYQTAPKGDLAAAMAEHRSRLARLESVMDELERLAEHVSDQC